MNDKASSIADNMELKISVLYVLAWTSVSLNAGDRDAIQNTTLSRQKFFQPDSCYNVSFQDICSAKVEQETPEGEYFPFRSETKVGLLQNDKQTSCLAWCQGKTRNEGDHDSLCFTNRSCCWKCPDQCKRSSSLEYSNLECQTIGQFENVWMVKSCPSDWPIDGIRNRCQNNFPDLLSWLPVLAKTGLSYRNVFCAHCNNDTNFDIWPLYAECRGRTPDKGIVLQEGTRSILNYLRKYCDVHIASTMDILTMARKIEKDNRRPSQYSPENTVDDLLKDFSSRVKRCLLRQDMRRTFAKHILSSVRDSFASYLDCKEVLQTDSSKATTFDSVTVGIDGERLVYWNMPMNFDMSTMLTKGRDKRWTPPSFSLLFQFHEPENKIVYSEESSTTNCISTATSCESGEVYDPFYRACRPVMCTTNQAFTGISCVETVPEATKDGRSVESVSGTVTLVVKFPAKYIHSKFNDSIALNVLTKCVTAGLHNVPALKGASLENITLTSATALDPENHLAPETDETAVFSLSLDLENEEQQIFPRRYKDIIQMANNFSNWIAFQRLEWRSDHVSIIVWDSYLLMTILPKLCEQHENEESILYFDNDYNVVDVDGHLWVYVPETYKSYPESDYQFLDWIVTVTENGAERTFIANSRVVVCDNEAMNVSSCHVFIPLNQTEYEVLPSGDVYLNERNTTVPRNETAIIDGTLAICIDEYLLNDDDARSNGADEIDKEMYYLLWVQIAVWINFIISILSLICLMITFVTYAAFQDLRSISGCCIMNLVVAQVFSMALYLFVAGAELYGDACTAVAIMLHFLFLSAFFWNNVISFDVWRTFGLGFKSAVNRMAQNRRHSTVGLTTTHGKKTIYLYMIYAWGTPCMLVFAAFALDMWVDSVNVGYEYDPCIGICWISNNTANLVAFGIPVFIILLVNIVFFCLTIFSIRKFEKNPTRISKKSQNVPSVSDEVDPAAISRNADNSGSAYEMLHGRAAQNIQTRIRIFFKHKNIRRSQSVHRTPSSYARANVFTYLKMSVLMGMSWLIGFMAVFAKVLVIWFIFELFVSLNGIFIFLAFVWKKRIRERYRCLLSACCSRTRCNENC